TIGLIFVSVLAPYAYRNQLVHGRLSPFPNKRWTFWEYTWLAEMRKTPAWEHVLLPERKIVPDWSTRNEGARDESLWHMGLGFVRTHPGTFLLQRARHVIWAYPIVPWELFRTPAPADGRTYGPTSLDDFVHYGTAAERLRVWTFRFLALLALGALIQ